MTFRSKLSSKHAVSLFFLLASASFFPQAAPAAVVTLNNGDQVSGEIVQMDDGKLTFKSAVFGEVHIPWMEVQRLVSDDATRIRLTDGSDMLGSVTLERDSVAIKGEVPSRTITLARADLAALNPPLRDGDVEYSGQLDFGGALNRGNTSDTQFNFLGSFEARAISYRYSLGMELNEARAAGATTTSTQRLRGQYDAFLSAKDYLFVNAKAERDELADLDLRTTLGAGYGRQFIERRNTRLAGQVGLSYVRENYGVAADQSFPGLALGLKYDRKFLGGKLVYFQYHDLDVSLQDAQDALLRTRLGIRVPIAQGLNVSTQLNLDYDTAPAVGNENLDSGLIFSVGYAF